MEKTFSIQSRVLGQGPCYIIAEVGSNHDRDKDKAFAMIQSAAQAGADAVKFQLFKAARMAADMDLPETRLQGGFAKFGRRVIDLYKDMELPVSWLGELKACCQQHRVDFLATPFDEESADQLAAAGVAAMKIASFEITHDPLLKHVAKLGLPVLLSTGMASLEEIRAAVGIIEGQGEHRVALFHCGIQYPAPFEAVHLRAMTLMRREFSCPVGYSDHTRGYAVAVGAVALGAQVYEKHLAMSSGQSPDQDFALKPGEFQAMVQAMRECEAALGSQVKELQPSEREHYLRGRRSLFVVKDVRKGDVFTRENLAVLRPGTGLPPSLYETVIGSRARRDIASPALLQEGDWQT